MKTFKKDITKMAGGIIRMKPVMEGQDKVIFERWVNGYFKCYYLCIRDSKGKLNQYRHHDFNEALNDFNKYGAQ